MSATRTYQFVGDGRAPEAPHPGAPTTPEPYVAAPELVEAINLAIYLGRPLLLEGEAGSGKTRLARAVAYELGLPLYPWYVRSTSKAQDGLYTYDALRRLHDVHAHQIAAPAEEADDQPRNPRNPAHYITFGALGRAFQLDTHPAVVLIDEIDKADMDFPNDLLTVLDDPWAFDIPETGERVAATADCRPIVLITSNKEKGNLPAPFLRRCIYHFIEFPGDETQLKQIIAAHYGQREGAQPSNTLTQAAIQRFQHLRSNEGGLYKSPGVSEFLDWLEALRAFQGADELVPGLSATDALPFPGLLLKLRMDWQRQTGRR